MPSRHVDMARFSNAFSVHASNNLSDLLLDFVITHCFQAIGLILSHGYEKDVGGIIFGSEGIEILPCATGNIG